MKNIRNFCIIAHIDHGKSTLADRLLEFTNTIQVTTGQMLDDMDLEKERGITIKSHAIQMEYNYKGEKYVLNLIDTPGHVDFSYEVSRSIAACEGALLIVDASQGVQAQTISNLYMAIEHDLEIIPVINKCDMASAMPEEVEDEIVELLGCKREEIIRASGKTGMGVEEILAAVIERIPHPEGDEEAPLQALIFDSVFNSFRGIIAYFKIENGVIRKGDKVKFFNTGKEYDADEVGVLKMELVPRNELRTGDVGYIISGIKTSKEVKVGDTITHVARPCDKAIAGFEEVKPMVFAGVYPIEAEDFEDLRASLEKLQLNDASLTFQPESSLALGFGFRCGFLGLLHMEIVQERLDREFDMNVITTVPNVSYNIYDKQGNMKEVHNPGGMPDPTLIDHIEEPYIKASIITTTDYIGPIMTLCLGKRGELLKQEYISGNRVEIYYNMPLGEIVIDFYDRLKSISKGYASFDYHPNGFRPSKLVKLDIMLNGEPVDALSTLIHFDNAYDMGRRMCEKLKELIPRQQFEIAIQAAIGAKSSWIYKKIQVLAIFDDLDTIILMIPLQIMMIGLRWQLIIVVVIVFMLLAAGWQQLNKYDWRQDWKAILFYSVIIFLATQILYLGSKELYGEAGSIHIEVLLPAFVLGMIMKHKEHDTPVERRVSTGISFFFMFLVGMSMPHFIGVNFAETHSGAYSVTGSQEMMSWGMILFHVVIVSLLSNVGKLCPMFFYRDRKLSERLALSIGMFTRGEVGAGIIFIALGYNLGGPALVISVLTLVLNLILTGIFVLWVKKLALRSYTD